MYVIIIFLVACAEAASVQHSKVGDHLFQWVGQWELHSALLGGD